MPNKSRQQLTFMAGTALAGSACVAVGVLVWYFFFTNGKSGPTPDELADLALLAPTKIERDTAAVKLCDYGDEAKDALRRVLRETKEVDVMTACIEGVGKLWDYESMDLLLNMAEQAPPHVRGRAAVVIGRMTGRERPFRAYDSQEDRRRIVRYMREDWEEIRNSPYFDDLKQRLREGYEQP